VRGILFALLRHVFRYCDLSESQNTDAVPSMRDTIGDIERSKDPLIVNEHYQNSLEPKSIIHAFVNYPPENFTINEALLTGSSIISFFADFNLLTTLEDKAKKSVDSLNRFRFFRYLVKKLLTPRTLFVGTSISEYCLLPESHHYPELAERILGSYQQSNTPLLIVKDIPCNSPLLSASENANAASFITLLEEKGLILVTGQALAYMDIDFPSFDAYLMTLSGSRRTDFRRKLKLATELARIEVKTGDAFFSDAVVEQLYQQYLNVFERNDIHFDKLSVDFFKQVFQRTDDGYVYIYHYQDKLVGFNLCYILGDMFVDKYIGTSDPEGRTLSLFYNMKFDNIKLCLKMDLKKYVVGYTSPGAKASLGCKFTYTYHAVYIRNPILRFLLNKLKPFFEGDRATLENLTAQPVQK